MNIDIIVPVLGRPEHAERFYDSLNWSYNMVHQAWTHKVRVFPMCENHEDYAAWDDGAFGFHTVFAEGHTFAEKVNEGYKLTDAEWVLLVGTDVKFHEGWVDLLETAARLMPEACVLGTKDWGNPNVMAGHFSPHPVIRRSYIDEQGASWDGPGIVCHEYHHCYVDAEICVKAKQLGVWLPTEAVIEHLHPYWGKAEHDEVYAEGESWTAIDQIEWERRLRQFGSPSPT